MNLYGTLMTASSDDRDKSQLDLIWAESEAEAKVKAHQKNVLSSPGYDGFGEAVVAISTHCLRNWAFGLYLIGVVYDETGKTVLNLVVATSPRDLNAVGHAVAMQFSRFKIRTTGMQVKGLTRLWASIRARN